MFRKVGCDDASELLLRLRLLFRHLRPDEALRELLRTLGGNQRAHS